MSVLVMYYYNGIVQWYAVYYMITIYITIYICILVYFILIPALPYIIYYIGVKKLPKAIGKTSDKLETN